jgi:signal transduction histidine kinase
VVGATIAALAIQAVARLSDSAFVPLLLVSLAVLLVAGPGRELALSGVRAALAPRDPVARVLASASGRLAVAQSAAEVWSIVDETCRRLPGDTRIHVLHADSPGSAFRDVFRSEGLAPRPEVAPGADLPALLDAERAPATRRYLEAEAASGPARARARARAACGELEASGADLVVPLLGGGALSGWIAVSGLPEEHVTAEVGAAFMAVAHQASANLERMAALEVARRREALAAVGEMAAGLAHEVRNPLAAIRGAVQVMAAAPDPERRREMIQVAEEETERLARVVGEFLDYARPGVTRREPVDLGEIARRVLRASDVAGRGLVADVRVAPGAPPALADPDQVERAFRNLVQNAADAAGPSGRLRIEILPGEAGAVAARFEDDGPGIAAEIMPKLFQPFCTGKPGGVGLGLALVHRVAEAHGGSVAVEPPRGRGACFVLTLPAAGGVAP